MPHDRQSGPARKMPSGTIWSTEKMESLGPRQARITLGKVIMDVFWGVMVFNLKPRNRYPARVKKSIVV